MICTMPPLNTNTAAHLPIRASRQPGTRTATRSPWRKPPGLRMRAGFDGRRPPLQRRKQQAGHDAQRPPLQKRMRQSPVACGRGSPVAAVSDRRALAQKHAGFDGRRPPLQRRKQQAGFDGQRPRRTGKKATTGLDGRRLPLQWRKSPNRPGFCRFCGRDVAWNSRRGGRPPTDR